MSQDNMSAMDRELLSPYAPMRYRNTAWWRWAVAAQRSGSITADRIVSDLPDQILEQLARPMVRGFELQVQGHPDAAELMAEFLPNVMTLRHWVPLAGQFEAWGREIFDLSDAVVSVLTHTDVKDATLENLNLPYEAFFMRFGLQEDAKLAFRPSEPEDPDPDPWEYFDGAFIARPLLDELSGKRRLVMGLTTVRRSGHGMQRPGYLLDFFPEEQTLPCLEAIDAALTRRLTQLNADRANHPDPNFRELGKAEAARYEQTAGLLRAALPLVMNGLFYLESLERHHTHVPGRDTPPDLLAQWNNASPDRRRRLRSQLTREGYSIVSLVGSEYDHLGPSATRGASSPHWRRGHWRMQPHGPGRTLRKRVRIAPQFIHPHDAPAEELPGHLYVAPSNSKQ